MPGTNEGKRNLPHDPGGRRSNEEQDGRRVRFKDEARAAEYEMEQEERVTTVERMANELRRCHDLIERGRQIVQQLFIELSHRKRKLQAQNGGRTDRLCRVDHLMQEIDILSQALQLSHVQKEEYLRQLEKLKTSCCAGRNNVQSMIENSRERNKDIAEKMDAFKQICLEQETLIQKLNRDNERLWQALTNLQVRMDEDRSLPNSPVRSVTRHDPENQFAEIPPESESETSWSTDNEYRMGRPRYDENHFQLPSTETSSLSKKLQKLLEQSENVQKLIATVGTKSQCELPVVPTERLEQENHVMESPVNSVESESSRYDMECDQCMDKSRDAEGESKRITVEDLLRRCREIEARIKRCSPGPLRNRFMHHCEMMEKPVKIKKKSEQFESNGKKFTKGSRVRNKVLFEDQNTQTLDQGGAINHSDIKTAQCEIAALREDLQTMIDNKCAMELSLRKDITELRTLLCSKDVEIEAMRKQVQEVFTATRGEKDRKQYEVRDHSRVAKSYRSKENDLNEIVDREMFIRLKEECERLKFALDRKTNEVDELREEMTRAISNIEELRCQLASSTHDRKIKQLEEENDLLKKENEHLKKLENEGIDEELASLQKAIEDAEVKLRRTKKEKEELNKRLHEREATISEVNKESERLYLENQELVKKLADSTSNFDQDTNSSIKELQELLRHRNELIDNMTAQFEVKESTYLESGKQKDEQVLILKETLKLREETCHTLQETIKQNEEEINELNEVVKSYQNKLLNDNAGFKKTLETLCQNSVDNIRDLKKENEDLKERLISQVSDRKEIPLFPGKTEERESREPSHGLELFPGLKDTLAILWDSLGQERLQQLLGWVKVEGISLDQQNQPTNSSGEILSSISQGEREILQATRDFLPGKDSACLQNLFRSFRDQGLTLNKEGHLFDKSGKKLFLIPDDEREVRTLLEQYIMIRGTKNAIRVLHWLRSEGVHFNDRDQLVDQHDRLVQAATLLGHQFYSTVSILLESGQTEKDVANLGKWVVENKPIVNDFLELLDSKGNKLFLMSGELARVIDECCKATRASEKEDLTESIKSTIERRIKFLPNGSFVDKFGIVYKHSSEDERASVSNLRDEIEALKNKISSIETTNGDSFTRHEQGDVEEKAFLTELENDKLRKEIDECYSKLQEYENELAGITSDLHQLAESRDRVIETSKRDITELQEKIRGEERRFKASTDSMSGLIEKLNVEKRALEDELTKAKEVISKLKSRSKELQEEINVEIDKQGAILEERDRWNDLKKTFEDEIERLVGELNAKEEIIEELSRGRSASRSKVTSESATSDETELESKQDKNIEIKKLQVENQLLRSRFVSLEDETTATTKIVADMERGHGHLTGALRCHLVFQKPVTAKLLENSLQTYHNEHEDLKKKFEMVETKYDREGNYSSRRDFARELFENARATIANIHNILDQGVIKVEDDLEKDFTDEDFEATDYKARLWILRRRLSDVERRHRELQLKAEELSIRLDAKTAEFEVTQDELEDATRDLETNEHSMTKLRGELDKCLRENLQLKDILAQLRDQHTFAVETVLTENEDLRRRVILHTEDRDNVMEGLKSDNEDLKKTVAKKEGDFVNLAAENSQRKVEIEKLRSRLLELESQLSKKETQNELLQKQIESMRAGARYHHHHGTIHMLRDDLKKLWSENTSLKEENLKKQKIINELSRELRNARSETREQRNLGEKLEKRLMESGSVAEPSAQMAAEIERLKVRLKGSETDRFKIEEEKYRLELKFEKETAEAKAKINELVLINEALLGQINRARERETRAKGEVQNKDGSMAHIQQTGSGDSLDVFQGKPSNDQQLTKPILEKTISPTNWGTKDRAEGQAVEPSMSTDSFDIFTPKTGRTAKNLLEESSDSLLIYSGSDRNISNTMDLEREQAKNLELVSELDETRRELQNIKEERKKLLDQFAEKENKLKESMVNTISESEKIVQEQSEKMKKINEEKSRLLAKLRELEEENRRLRHAGASEDETCQEQGDLRRRIMELETELMEKETELALAEAKFNRTRDEFPLHGGESEKELLILSQDSPSLEVQHGKNVKSSSREECILPVDEATSMAEKFDFPFQAQYESRDTFASKISRPRRGETPSPVRGYMSRIPVATSPKSRRLSVDSTEFSLGSASQETVKEAEMRAAIETVDYLTKEVVNLKQELKEARAAKAKLPLIESENDHFKAEIDRLQLEVKELRHKAMKINNEKSEMSRLRQEVKELREMKETASEIRKENETLKEELEKSKEHIKDLIKKLAKHSNGKSELVKVKQELKEANEAKQKVTDLQKMHTSAQEEITKLNKRVADLTIKLSKKSLDKESHSPRGSMPTAQGEDELVHLKSELKEKNSEIEVLKKELSEVQSLLVNTKPDDFSFTDLKSEYTQSSDDNVAVCKQTESSGDDEPLVLLKEKLESLSLEMENANIRTSQLEAENKALRIQLVDSKTRFTSPSENLVLGNSRGDDEWIRKELASDTKVTQTSKEAQNIRNIDNFTRGSAIEEGEVDIKDPDRLQEKISILMRESQEQTSKLSYLEEECSNVKSENKNLSQQVLELTEAAGKYQKRIMATEKIYNSMKKEKEEMEAELALAMDEKQKACEALKEADKKIESFRMQLSEVQGLESEVINKNEMLEDTEKKRLDVSVTEMSVTKTHQETVETHEMEIAVLTRKVQDLEMEISKLTLHLKKEKEFSQTLIQEKRALNRNLNQLKKKRDELKTSLELIKSQTTTTVTTIVEEFEEILEGDPRVPILEENLKQRESEIAIMKLALEAAIDDNADEEDSSDDAEEVEFASVPAADRSSDQNIIKSLEEKIRLLEEASSTTETYLNKAKQEIKRLEAERDDLLNKITSFEEMFRVMETGNGGKEESAQDTILPSVMIEQLRATLSEVEREKDELREQLKESGAESERLSKEVESLMADNLLLKSSQEEALNSPRDSDSSLESESSLRDSEREYITASTKKLKKRLLGAYRDLKEKSVELATLRMNWECRSIEMDYDRDVQAVEEDVQEKKKASESDQIICAKSEYNTLVAKIAALEKEAKERELKLSSAEKEIKILKPQAAAMQEERGMKNREGQELHKRYEEMISMQREKIENLLSQNEKKGKKINELQESLQDRTQVVRHLRSELDRVEEKYRHEVMKRQGWMQEKEELTGYKDKRIMELERKFMAAESKVLALETANEEYHVEQEKLRDEIMILQNRLVAKNEHQREGHLQAAEEKDEQYVSLHDQAEIQKQQYELEIKSLQSSLAALKSEQVGSTREDYDRILAERMDLQTTVTQLEHDLTRKENTLDEMYTKNRLLEIELSAAETRITDLIDELADLDEVKRRLTDAS